MRKLTGYNDIYDDLSYTAEQKAQIAQRAAMAANAAQRTARRRHHGFSKFVAAAACLVSVLTISAEAAGIPTPVSGILAPIFGGTVAQTEVIDKIGRPVDASDTDNGITISADAIIGDEYNACIVFTIRRDDGTALLPDGVTAQQLTLGGICDVGFSKTGSSHGSAWFVDPVPGDNEIQYLYTISSDEPLNKGTCTVTFDGLSYFSSSEESVPVLEGKWKFRFDVDYEDTSVTLGSGETFQQDGLNFTITEIRVSPIAVQVSYEADSEVQWTNAPSGRLPEEDRRQMERYLDNIQILLVKKDGSVIDMSSSGGSIRPENGRSYCTKGGVLEEVIPLEELESIQVGGISFPITS